MCGILGAINQGFGFEQLRLLHHRGPDHSNLLTFNFNGNTIIFGHTRLSIIDLSSAGHQPMNSADGNSTIIFNGEVYNHLELKCKLNNIKFNGHCDTETVVNYIARFGIKAIADFNGIFALAIFDREKRKIYLARDRFGVKPLYYWQNSNKFIFSSEIKPIVTLRNIRELNKEALFLLLRLRYIPSPLTMWKGVWKLKPGHILEIDLKNLQANEICFIKPVDTNYNLTEREAIEIYLNELELAVKRQLLSDVELGILLSGGVDSALVAHFAQKNYKKLLKTFTIGFGFKDEVDELSEAKKTSEIIGTKHYEIIMTKVDFVSIFEDVTSIVEEPLGVTSELPMYYLTKEVSKYMKVVLSGQGADEPWGGYARYQGEFIRDFIPPVIFKVFSPLFKNSPNEKLRRAFNSLGEKDTIRRFMGIYTLFPDSTINKLINFSLKPENTERYFDYFYKLFTTTHKKPLDVMMNIDSVTNLSEGLLLYTDKISMHHSLEVRVPFLDTQLMNFIESLPYKFKVGFLKSKILHKKAAEKIFLKNLVYRRKKGFASPTKAWFSGKMGKEYQEMLIYDRKFCELFSKKEVYYFFDLHQKGKFNFEKELFLLVSIYYWLKKFM